MTHDLRQQFVLAEIRCEQHYLDSQRGRYDAVADHPIMLDERDWAEAVLAGEAAAAERINQEYSYQA